MLGKIFRSKKSEYFLEFGDNKKTDTTKTESAPASAPATKAEPANKEATAARIATAKAATTKPAAAEPQPKPEAPKEPAPLNSGVVKTPAGMTFAPDYLMPQSTGGRRRPGQNMTMFKQMARQMKR